MSDHDDRAKRPHPFNPIALVAIAVLIAVGWYLLQTLGDASRSQDCIQSGRKNCAPIDESTVK